MLPACLKKKRVFLNACGLPELAVLLRRRGGLMRVDAVEGDGGLLSLDELAVLVGVPPPRALFFFWVGGRAHLFFVLRPPCHFLPFRSPASGECETLRAPHFVQVRYCALSHVRPALLVLGPLGAGNVQRTPRHFSISQFRRLRPPIGPGV